MSKHESHKIKYSHPEIRETSDGSPSLFHEVLGELYHSRHGAWTESHHIFIANALIPYLDKFPASEEIKIFEMGFGSGLNAVLTAETAREYRRKILFTSIELYPVAPEVIRKMEYPFEKETTLSEFREIHRAAWGQPEKINEYFTLHKIQGSFPEDISAPEFFDLIYYDAFAPGAQPALWEETTMAHCFRMLKRGGIWISFSSKGSVQRNLRNAGFEVTKLPGPPGKREITRAAKPE